MCLDPTHAPDGQDRVLIRPVHLLAAKDSLAVLTGRIASPVSTGSRFVKSSSIAALRLPSRNPVTLTNVFTRAG